MKKVTITQLKDKLSSLLASASRGEEVLVYDRNTPYVRVVGLQYSSELTEDDQVARLEQQGQVRAGSRKKLLDALKTPPLKTNKECKLREAVLDDRDEMI